MATLRTLDALLAEALDCLDRASRLVRELRELDEKASLKHIGSAIVEIWPIRDAIHRLQPDLKPSFVEEHKQDSARYEALGEISDLAHDQEKAGDVSAAAESFSKLHKAADGGFFGMVAEAGLYRCSKAN